MRPQTLAAAVTLLAAVVPTLAGDNLPPFDFSDAFYLANGINPAAIVGGPTGTPPGSIIDNRENGPDLSNVRILAHAAAYDHSGHPIFFSVTGILPSAAAFTSNQAGREAFQIAETYNVYEFPRAGNPQYAVFPKRQDLVADLRNGYFSNDPLGIWKINLVRYTPAATGTAQGRQALADLAARNGRDMDGSPLIRTVSEIEGLANLGFVTIEAPPIGSGALRWFMCPVVEDPRDGAIAPDAHLDVTQIPAAQEFIQLFDCLQRTGRECETRVCVANCDNSLQPPVLNVNDFTCFMNKFAAGEPLANCDGSTTPPVLNVGDFVCFMNRFAAGCP